ncbi:hypothetical protein ABZ622_40750 [Streptomyces sp. NPDC007164]|uniref:hypothetical protein n=1 Tax=Streptomyces sp. NPDC007164 TaxID=3156918 RepID=UPI003402B856
MIALTDGRGCLLWVSAARPGRTSEITACWQDKLTAHLRAAGIGAIADLGFVGLDDNGPDADPAVITGYKAAHNRPLTRSQNLSKAVAAVRASVEHGADAQPLPPTRSFKPPEHSTISSRRNGKGGPVSETGPLRGEGEQGHGPPSPPHSLCHLSATPEHRTQNVVRPSRQGRHTTAARSTAWYPPTSSRGEHANWSDWSSPCRRGSATRR